MAPLWHLMAPTHQSGMFFFFMLQIAHFAVDCYFSMFLAIHFGGMLFISCFKLQRTKVFGFWNSFGAWEAYVLPLLCFCFIFSWNLL
jgi:hypothetical protein